MAHSSLGKNFYEANFKQRADFSGTNFQGEARFCGTKFEEEADFYNTKFKEVKFVGIKFIKSNFSRAEFIEADFCNAEFTELATFFGAQFSIRGEFIDKVEHEEDELAEEIEEYENANESEHFSLPSEFVFYKAKFPKGVMFDSCSPLQLTDQMHESCELIYRVFYRH
jgi:hypothetical protein